MYELIGFGEIRIVTIDILVRILAWLRQRFITKEKRIVCDNAIGTLNPVS